jgi:threonine/homoserine/homoserine lactone efflux protein
LSDLLIVLVPAAVGVALSPVPVIEMILVLFSRRRTVNSVVFVVALMLSTAVVLAIGVAGGRVEELDGDAATAASGVTLFFGLVLLAIGVMSLRNRADRSEPKIFDRISEMGPPTAIVLGVTAVFLNPKNIVLLLAAGQTIANSDSDANALVAIIFLLVSMSTFIATTVYALFGGEAAKANLDRARVWLVARNRLIVGLVCTAIGVALTADAVSSLFL